LEDVEEVDRTVDQSDWGDSEISRRKEEAVTECDGLLHY